VFRPTACFVFHSRYGYRSTTTLFPETSWTLSRPDEWPFDNWKRTQGDYILNCDGDYWNRSENNKSILRVSKGISRETSDIFYGDNVFKIYLKQGRKKILARHKGRSAAKATEDETDNLCPDICLCIGARVMLTTNELGTGALLCIQTGEWQGKQVSPPGRNVARYTHQT
jgi:hypothetical protein